MGIPRRAGATSEPTPIRDFTQQQVSFGAHSTCEMGYGCICGYNHIQISEDCRCIGECATVSIDMLWEFHDFTVELAMGQLLTTEAKLKAVQFNVIDGCQWGKYF